MQTRVWYWGLSLITACATTLRRDTERAERHYLLGLDYFAKGQDGPALEQALEAIKQDTQHAEAHHLVGLVFLRKGVTALQVAEVDQCLDGLAEKEQREEADAMMRKARAEFEKAVALNKEYSEAYNSLAVVALHFKEYDAAIELGRKALGNIIYRQPHLAYGNVGWAHYHKGDLVRAAKELRQAVFHQPEFCVGHYRLAEVYLSQKQLPEVLEELELVKKQNCPIQEAYVLAGMAYGLLHQPEQAREAFAKCVTLAPKSCRAQKCERDRRLIQ